MVGFVEKYWIALISIAQIFHIKQRRDVLVFFIGKGC